MQTLFIGQSYIDVTFLTDHMPVGDEKYVAQDYAISFGGNAVTAAFCCAKLGIKPDLLSTAARRVVGGGIVKHKNRLVGFENATDLLTIGLIVALGLAMVIGLVTASGSVTW